MAEVQDIIYGVSGQSIYLDAPEGRPTSVTSVGIFAWDASDDAATEFAATGTVETDPDTTLSAAAGTSQSDPRLIALTSGAGVVIGRSYLLTAATTDGHREFVEAAGAAALSMRARTPLYNDYAAGDTLVSTRMTAAVDATWAATLSKVSDDTDANPGYRVRWAYVVGGVTHVRHTYLDLVRAPGGHNVRPADIERMVPGFLYLLPEGHEEDRGAGLIDEAYTQLIVDLAQEGIADETLRNQDLVDELVKARAVLLWSEARRFAGSADGEVVDLARDVWERRWNSLVKVPSRVKIPASVDSTGAARTVAPIGLTRR